MITLSNENRVALLDAISSGVLSVEYSDKKVVHRSLAEMLQILKMFDVDGRGKKSNVRATNFIKGY